MSTKKHWQKAARSIPFIAEFAHGGERAVNMELQRLKALKAPTPAESALLEELERYRPDPFHAAALDQTQLLGEAAKDFEAAERRALRRGGVPGRTNPKTNAVREYIRELMAEHPKLSPPQLYGKADKSKLPKPAKGGRSTGPISEKTFCGHVRALTAK